ncbi:glutaminase A [filamentous cyanobacterium CCP5]|nr:glutaminase A [filamentous cyanobacterium CCP5]
MTRVEEFLQALHDRYQSLRDGQLASYIPELAKANPDWLGISVVTLDGRSFEVGDIAQKFTIQSISKVFVYGMALEDHGREALLKKVGVEPTGDPFNSLIRLDMDSKRPDNPMINAGAIATTSLLKGQNPTERLNRMLAMFERYIGHEVFIDVPVFMSERATGHRNRAMAHLMFNFGMVTGDVDEALDLYFQQCSLLVTGHDLAVMAATLANGGINPVTGERALDEHYVQDVISVMLTCGMYDYSGEWTYRVGMPAKSGVGGGITAVVPGKLGIGTFSPPLDAKGNSYRGIRVCESLARDFGLHLFNVAKADRDLEEWLTGSGADSW